MSQGATLWNWSYNRWRCFEKSVSWDHLDVGRLTSVYTLPAHVVRGHNVNQPNECYLTAGASGSDDGDGQLACWRCRPRVAAAAADRQLCGSRSSLPYCWPSSTFFRLPTTITTRGGDTASKRSRLILAHRRLTQTCSHLPHYPGSVYFSLNDDVLAPVDTVQIKDRSGVRISNQKRYISDMQRIAACLRCATSRFWHTLK